MAYNVIFTKKVKNAKKIEQHLHKIYSGELLLNMKNYSKEWYPIKNDFFDSLDEFIADIEKNIKWAEKVI